MSALQSTGENWAPAGLAAQIRTAGCEIFEECAAQKAQLFLWSPVFLSFGIGLYYALPAEPPLVLGLLGFLAGLSLLAFPFSERAPRAGTLALMLVALGFFAAQLRTQAVHTPILEKKIPFAIVSGTIEAVEDLGDADGSRLVLRDLSVRDLAPAETPRKARLKIRHDEGLEVGRPVTVMAGLNPPSLPVLPGGFDFRRHLYFRGIGAVGFVYKEIEAPVNKPAPGSVDFIERQRQYVATQAERYMHYPAAAVGIALLNGRGTAIAEDDRDAMRDSGLAHLLAISGLHVGLFCGVLFFFSRLFMALIPGLALRYPIKKFAAVVAMAGGFYYMLVAGAPVPTQRAVVMSSIVFFAILVDRSPISLRTVAFAALAVLLLFPDSLLSVSFQMSFAAVAWLIWCFERLAPAMAVWRRRAGFIRRAALYFLGVCLTTLIASLATAPFALYHFQQFSALGVVANLVAVPLMAFVIMPGVVGVLLLLPLHSGLEAFPFFLMQKGIGAVLETAHWAAALPHAVLHVQAWPFATLLCFAAAMLTAGLWRGHLRAVAAVFLALVFLFTGAARPPDLMVAPDYDLVAYRAADGGLHVSSLRRGAFTRENWARALGLDPDAAVSVWPREGHAGAITCGGDGCRIALKGYEVAYTDDPLSLPLDCAQADIVLAAIPARGCEAPLVVDLLDVKRGGGATLWLGPAGPIMRTPAQARGRRPWSGLNRDFRRGL